MIRCSYLCACMEASDAEEYGALRQETRGASRGCSRLLARALGAEAPAPRARSFTLCIVTSRTANKRIISSLLMTV